MEKRYVKGFVLNREKIAKLAEVESPSDPEVDVYTRVIVNALNRPAYQFIGIVYAHVPPGQHPDGNTDLELAIVLEMGYDEEELRKKELPPIDESIAFAQPHVLDGPDVWEYWG